VVPPNKRLQTDSAGSHSANPVFDIAGACFGFIVGGVVAALSWRQLAVGQRPAFVLEVMSFLAAPPFGLLLSYPIGAAQQGSLEDRRVADRSSVTPHRAYS